MIADALRNNTQLKTLWLGVRDAMATRSLLMHAHALTLSWSR